MSRIFIYPVFLFFLSGCFEEEKQILKENRVQLGDIKINYYSDKSVTSLEVPPDLTAPKYENSFRLSELVNDLDVSYADLGGKEEIKEQKEKVFQEFTDISVKKSGSRRWLEVNKSPDLVWNLSRQFLKDQGFIIKKSNKKIGLMETDYLENKPEIPGKSLGIVRSMFTSLSKDVSYTLPTVDKYTIRIEPIDSDKMSEVHLSLSSMAEVAATVAGDESTLWQFKEKDVALENEMLYMLMVYLGGDSAKAREKIVDAKEQGKVFVTLEDGLNGYAKLVFKLNFIDTWDNMSWAISNLDTELEDKDIREKTFYLSMANELEKGIMSKLLGDDAIRQSYQLRLKSIGENRTEVYFNDISEMNEKSTKEFSYLFLENIQKQF